MSASFCSSSSTACGGTLSRLNTVNARPPAVSRPRLMLAMLTLCFASSVPRWPTMPGLSVLFNKQQRARDRNFHRLAEQPHDARIVRRTEERSARRNQFLAVAENLDVNPFVERHRLVRFFFLDRDADALRHAADVDVVDVLQIARGQKAAQNRARHRVNVRQQPRIAAISDVNAGRRSPARAAPAICPAPRRAADTA